MAVNILDISKKMFTNKSQWETVTEEEKNEAFFIFNRYFSKTYPDYANKLNDKNINKAMAMDMWFIFMYDKAYPSNFWSKTPKDINLKENPLDSFDKKIIYRIKKEYSLSWNSLKEIAIHHTDILKNEIKYYKSLDKN